MTAIILLLSGACLAVSACFQILALDRSPLAAVYSATSFGLCWLSAFFSGWILGEAVLEFVLLMYPLSFFG